MLLKTPVCKTCIIAKKYLNNKKYFKHFLNTQYFESNTF